jgi:hypothetical protein
MDGTRMPAVFQAVFTTLADQIGRDTGCIERQRLLSGATLAQTFVFAYLHQPEPTDSLLAQTAAQAGVVISVQALEQRLDQPQTADFFKALLEQAVNQDVRGLASDEPALERLRRFSAVNLLDSTSVALPDELANVWPGCGANSPQGGKAALKVQAQLDLLSGALRLELTPGRACDQKTTLQTAHLQADSLHLRDLGYFDLDVLGMIAQANAFFLTRLKRGTMLFDSQGLRLDLEKLLRDRKEDLDITIFAGKNKRLPMRLLARRLPPEIAEKRRRKLQHKAKDRGGARRYTPSDESLELCGWTIAVTNAPLDKLTLDDALALLRLRWQIELLFKLWKSQGGLGRSRSQKPQRLLAETYAKLLALLVRHWLLWQSVGRYADRSLAKAILAMRAAAWLLLVSLPILRNLKKVCARLAETLAKSARIKKRAKKPAAFQVIDDPKRHNYEPCA